MKDIKIMINKQTRMVKLSKTMIGNDGENLQSNFVFEFEDEFINGQARLEYIIDGERKYVFLNRINETYTTPVKSFLTKKGTIDMQLVILEGTDENNVPIFKSNMFYVYCNPSINAEVEVSEVSSDWLEIANTKLNQVDNLDINANKIETTTTINITNKEGTTTSTEIYDGRNGKDGYTPIKGVDYFDGKDGVSCTHSWNGTILTINSASGTTSANLKGETGLQGVAGKNGYTPIKGIDYYTEEDKQEIVNDVLNSIPSSEGVEY